MKRNTWKKVLAVAGLCTVLWLPDAVAAYDGVKTSEMIRYNYYGASYQKEEVEKIGKGVDHIKVSKLMKDGWVDIHLLRIDTKEPAIAVKTLRSDTWKKKDSLKNMADLSNEMILGAVNGSYFGVKGEYSDSQGVEFEGGLRYFDTLLRAGLFINKDNTFFFSHANDMAVYDAASGEALDMPLQIANNFPSAEGVAIYNNFLYRDSKTIDAGGEYYKVKVVGGEVVEIVPPYQTATFESEGYTLVFASAKKDYVDRLYKGRNIKVKSSTGVVLDSLQTAIAGGGYLLINGEVSYAGELVQPYRRHPRTALGLDRKNGLFYMVVVDGRGSSIGATHAELAGYLKEWGITEAIAMDGGGSSVMLARNLGEGKVNIENALPQNYQRKVINGLAVVSTQSSGAAQRLIVNAKQPKAFVNVPVDLEIRAVDGNDLPVGINTGDIYWKVSGIKGTVVNSRLIAEEKGVAEVTAYQSDKVFGKTLVEITSQPIDLRANPYVLEVAPNQTGSFELIGTDESGFVGKVASASAVYKLEDETIGYFTGGVFTASKRGGMSRVTITVDGRSTTAYIIAGKQTQASEEFIERPIGVSVEGNVTLSASQTPDIGYDDFRSLSIGYYFPQAEESEELPKQKASLRYEQPILIEKPAEKIDLFAYGNGDKLRMTMEVQDSEQVWSLPIHEGDWWTDWRAVSVKLPAQLKYPAQVLGYTIENMGATQNQGGAIYLDAFHITSKLKIHTEVYQEYPSDKMRKSFKRNADFSAFGITAGKNRILDAILIQKVTEMQKKAGRAIYAGPTELPAGELRPQDIAWTSAYKIYELPKTRVIQLASVGGSYKNADPKQFQQLAYDLSNTLAENIILLSDVHPLEEKKHKREAQAMHELISRFAKTSGKTIYYVAASGYQTGVTLKDGVRYLKTNGLWYEVTNRREIDLNRKFYQLNFYLEQNKLYYDIVNLYPLVE